MKTKTITALITAILAVAMLSSMLLVPMVSAWSYGNPATPNDNKEEYFGPRANKLLIPLYATEITEWDSLATISPLSYKGLIDVTDWPLSDVYAAAYTTPPLNNSVDVEKYGPEFGMREFDLNMNNNTILDYPNIVNSDPNPAIKADDGVVTGNPMAELSMRIAIAYLTDRNNYVNHIGPLTNVAVYTMLGANSLGISPWGKYTDFDITPAGSQSALTWPFSETNANNTLNAAGVFGYIASHSGMYRGYKGHPITIKLVARVDDPYRDYAGTQLAIELGKVGFYVNLLHIAITAARAQVMASKNFSIYTGGWSLSVTPDFIILWNWPIGYWHPGNPYDYGGINDADYNTDSYNVMVANTQADAETYSIAAQLRMASQVLMIPLWISAGGKVVSRTYTGGNGGVANGDGEDIYRGHYWQGFTNEAGFGKDNGQTFLNMRPEGFDWGNGNMTIRYGFKTANLNQLNPLYTEFLWDNTVIDLCGYDSLVTRNPDNLAEFDNWATRNYTVTTYENPVLGTCTKVIYTLRNDYFYQDGYPVTSQDCYFTDVEIALDLAARHLAKPWWWSNVLDILSFTVIDPYSFEVLYDVKSIYAVGWAGGTRILPEHIWKPIVKTGDPTTFAPDPSMIESGPWRLAEYVAGSHILLVANTPGSTVKTTGDPGFAGSVAVTSPMGYFRLLPVDIHTDVTAPSSLAYMTKLPAEDTPTTVTLTTTYENLFADRDVNIASSVTLNGAPVTIPTPTWVLGHNGTWATVVSATGFDLHGVFDDIYGGFSYWYYVGTALVHVKILCFEPQNAMTMTWGGLTLGTPLTPETDYTVILTDSITFLNVAQMTILPLNVKFHYDIEWYTATNTNDVAGSNWFDDVRAILVHNPLPISPPFPYTFPAWPLNYVYKNELQTPDGVVDGTDLSTAAHAFGSFPGQARWSSISDVNHDYVVDGADLAQIAKFFGWPPATLGEE